MVQEAGKVASSRVPHAKGSTPNANGSDSCMLISHSNMQKAQSILITCMQSRSFKSNLTICTTNLEPQVSYHGSTLTACISNLVLDNIMQR
jgi:hypothetical protein